MSLGSGVGQDCVRAALWPLRPGDQERWRVKGAWMLLLWTQPMGKQLLWAKRRGRAPDSLPAGQQWPASQSVSGAEHVSVALEQQRLAVYFGNSDTEVCTLSPEGYFPHQAIFAKPTAWFSWSQYRCTSRKEDNPDYNLVSQCLKEGGSAKCIPIALLS